MLTRERSTWPDPISRDLHASVRIGLRPHSRARALWPAVGLQNWGALVAQHPRQLAAIVATEACWPSRSPCGSAMLHRAVFSRDRRSPPVSVPARAPHRPSIRWPGIFGQFRKAAFIGGSRGGDRVGAGQSAGAVVSALVSIASAVSQWGLTLSRRFACGHSAFRPHFLWPPSLATISGRLDGAIAGPLRPRVGVRTLLASIVVSGCCRSGRIFRAVTHGAVPTSRGLR